MAEAKRRYMTCSICGRVHYVLTEEEVAALPPWEVAMGQYCRRCHSGSRRFRPTVPGDREPGVEDAPLIHPAR